MFEVPSGEGELYLIAVQEGTGWRAVGDAALRLRVVGTHWLCQVRASSVRLTVQ